ncbi:unnamed protein product [Periconia digitata]|uniref:DUF7580 domain-containing protein n=1 Tax=Periconia digitata TaxID=1303443 RepID=A0A9W4TZT5_9PLEO|nr:unnamed protein product [Periconia digitata]
MSGFEVAGVVLGSIPILVEAVKSYADGVSTVKGIFTYEETYLEIHSSLVVSLASFRHSCEGLLRGLVLPHSQFVALIERYEGWDDEDLAKRLKIKMGERDFDTYMTFATRLRKRLVLLAEKLHLRKDFTPVFVIDGNIDPKKRKQFFKNPMARVRGAIESSRLKKVVEEIATDVGRLRDLSNDAPKLEEERQERASASVSTYWLSMRDHASLVFTALQSAWFHGCQIHKHLVNLCVTRPESKTFFQDLAVAQLGFELEAANKNTIQRQVKVIASAPSNISPAPKPGTKKLRFAAEPARMPNHEVCKPEKILSLCASLSKKCPVDCLGYLHVDTTNNDYHFHSVEAWPQSSDLVPLRRYLQQRITTRSGIPLRERCNYSIQLASAVMQLFDTPWLDPHWTLDDIYVDKNTQHPRGQIYIKSLFRQNTPSTSPSTSNTMALSTTPPFVKNEIVFALGIALLELAHAGKELSSFATPSDLDKDGNSHLFTRYMITDRLTKEMQVVESPRFACAVAKCVWPASDTFEFRLSNEGYRKRFWGDVLQPLEKDWEALFGSQ